MPRGAQSKAREIVITEADLKRLAIDDAKMTGKLPHEWLLDVVRGQPVLQRYWHYVRDAKGEIKDKELREELVYPDVSVRIDVAKSIAPYFAPRMATQFITQTPSASFQMDTEALAAMPKDKRREVLEMLKRAGVNLELTP